MSRPLNSNMLPSLSSLGLRERGRDRRFGASPSLPSSNTNIGIGSVPGCLILGLFEQPPMRPLDPREPALPQIRHPQQWGDWTLVVYESWVANSHTPPMSRPLNSNMLPSLSNLGLRERGHRRFGASPSLPSSNTNIGIGSVPGCLILWLFEQPPMWPLDPRELTLPQIRHPQQWGLPGPPTPDVST
ncbi:hypothetical protein JB92DRAFT_3143312 [Gautieria morchelliformis]|nr:hypothetical protein JB92DRAFT_3143312 [Gautieria morchelliformis]